MFSLPRDASGIFGRQKCKGEFVVLPKNRIFDGRKGNPRQRAAGFVYKREMGIGFSHDISVGRPCLSSGAPRSIYRA